MKLAQALAERADIQKRIAQLKGRLLLNAKVQDGEKPAEDPKALLKELDELVTQFETIVTRINQTNAQTTDQTECLTALLSRRDALAIKLSILRDFLAGASATVTRGTKTEIRILSTIPVAAQQKEVDRLSKQLRDLDDRIQSLNWTTELL